MKKQVLLVSFILTLFTSAYSQDNNLGDIERIKKGNNVVMNSRKAIGVEKGAINALHLKSKTSTTTKIKTSSGLALPDKVDEINIMIPDKIQWTWTIEKPFPSKSTSLWNGKQYKKLLETDFLGNREIRDVTNLNLKAKANYKDFEGRISKESLEMLKKVREEDPREHFNNRLWNNLFPLILIHPFENNLEFKYAGKAESSNRVANVVDVESKNGRNYRLLFDSETNYLLMMIENYKSSDGEYESKYYFSNRELVNNVLIPKTIKVESKSTLNGKTPVISYQNIDIEEFSLNPEFKKNLFDIN